MTVTVLNEVRNENGFCFQRARWDWEDDEPSVGYRFVYVENGRIKPRRGQAIIPDAATMFRLLATAMEEGWLH